MGKKETNYKPARLIPFDLYNIKDFIHRDHESYHPVLEMDLYKDYWDEQARLCLEGKWGLDQNKETLEGGYRWMPGNLYFYINMTQIKIEEEQGREAFSAPYLRDIEWFMFYALTECDGFSGFELDEEYTCYEPLGKLQGKVKDDNGKVIDTLSNKEKIRIERFGNILKKPNGEYKEYISPKEYLYKTFDKPMGKPLYYNEMKNLVVLSSRGVGKSYSVSNGVVCYDFVFGSSRTTEELWKRTHPSVSVVGAFDSSKSRSLLNKFEVTYEYMRKNVGAFQEDGLNSVFYQPYEGSLTTGRNITNMVKEEGSKSFTGTGSEVWHISYQNNASAGVGYRARRMVVEEAGLMSNFIEAHGENNGTQKRETKIGYTVYIGTGGNVEKIKGIRDAFYHPSAYDCVRFDDTFSNKPGKIGLFIPAYYRSLDYKDENGNTDIQAAFEDEMAERAAKKAAGSRAYERHIISYPIVPSEMFLASSGNIFPSDLLEDRITELETGLWEELAHVGKLYYTNDSNTECKWEPMMLQDVSVIKHWGDERDMTDEQKAGTIVIYEHPVINKPSMRHQDYMYLVTYDPVRDDEGGTSLACVIVWKFWDLERPWKTQYNIVAEWSGRHIKANGLEEDHEIAFKLASYYSCPILPEVNLKDIKRYARMTNRYYYLLPKPKLALDGMEITQKKDYDVGVYISPGMKPDLEKYTNEVLLTVVDQEHTIVGNKEYLEETRMISKCPSLRFCEEHLYYTRDENYDYVSNAMLFSLASRQRYAEPAKERMQAIEEEESRRLLEFFEGEKHKVEHTKKYTAGNRHPAFSY